MLHQSATWYTFTKQNMAAKKEHNLHTEQGPKDALPAQERQVIYHIAFSCKNMGEKKRGGGVEKVEESFFDFYWLS